MWKLTSMSTEIVTSGHYSAHINIGVEPLYSMLNYATMDIISIKLVLIAHNRLNNGGWSVLFEVTHMPKSTMGWVGVNLQISKSTFGTFRWKKGVLGVFLQILKSTFGTILPFFFYFFQQNLRYFRYFCQIFKVVSGSYTYLYVILFNTWLFYILVNI